MTPSGIEPATFRFVAQYLNHCGTVVNVLFEDALYLLLFSCRSFISRNLQLVIPKLCLNTGMDNVPSAVIYSVPSTQTSVHS